VKSADQSTTTTVSTGAPHGDMIQRPMVSIHCRSAPRPSTKKNGPTATRDANQPAMPIQSAPPTTTPRKAKTLATDPPRSLLWNR